VRSIHRKTFTERERVCILVSGHYTLQKRESAFKLIKRQKKLGARLFTELFFHLSLVLGFPTMLDGLEKLAKMGLLRMNHQGPMSPRQTLRSNGMRVLTKVYGNQTQKLLQSLKILHPHLPAMIVEDVYGKVVARRGMTLRERELVNITVLCVQGLERQLFSHVRGALRIGVSSSLLQKLFHLMERELRISTRGARQILWHLEEPDVN